MRLILLSTIAILFLSACDEGRVINEKERQKVLTDSGDLDYDFAQSLRIWDNGSTPHSEYTFGIISAYPFARIALHSLLVLEQDKNPLVDIENVASELECAVRKKKICTSWSHTFNLAQSIPLAPALNFTVTLTPDVTFKMGSVDENAVLTEIAQYDVFNLTFSWSDKSSTFKVVKQKFLVQSFLAHTPNWSFLNSENFLSLFNTSFYWPGPPFNYTYNFVDFYSIVGKQIDFTLNFSDNLTGTNKRFRYIIERL